MYLAPLDSDYYAFIPKRRFFTPWVWDLRVVMGLREQWKPQQLASNLRRHEVVGLLQLFNAYNIGE
jgi:hypothetical protein